MYLWRFRMVSQHLDQEWRLLLDVRFIPDDFRRMVEYLTDAEESQCSRIDFVQHWRQLPTLGIDANGLAAVKIFQVLTTVLWSR